jgi:predicted PurR-regulated permease PerM
MESARPADPRGIEDKTFLLLLIASSLAFAWILSPFFEAIFWAAVLAILFEPLYRRLSSAMRQRRTLAALATLVIILVLVILPLALIAALLLQEGSGVYGRLQSGALDPGQYFRELFGNLPAWVANLLNRFGLTDLGLIQERLSSSLTKSSQFLATQALNIGQNAFQFIVALFITLYLLFFLLRDGDALSERIGKAAPLRSDQARNLSNKFTIVIRATVKGNLVMGVVQGALGGLIFWILGIHAPVLWGALMAILSLLPAIGAAVVWLPVAAYFLLTGSLWQGIALIAYGVVVIGTVDNFLRPILVGKDTQMPDYVVLISTLGGIAVFGLSGFVIGPAIAAMFMATWDIYSASRSAIRTDRDSR